MFRDRDHARAVIQNIAIDDADEEPISSEQVELLIEALAPQFWIARNDGSAIHRGMTRLGGGPDLPDGTVWPVRPAPPDAERTAADLEQHFDWIAKHIVRDLPFEFLAQIDLTEAATHPEHASALPHDGRLLFFWDGVVGLIQSGPAACRVIWDRTPAKELRRLAIPRALEELDAAYDPEGRFKKPYVYPERPMRLNPILTLPDRHTADMVTNGLLTALADDMRHENSYARLTAMDEGQFITDGLRGARLHRVLGPPIPDQDDPRFDAIVADGFPPAPWKGEQLTDAARRALDWQLLAQFNLGDLAQQDLTEGMVYFLIRKTDLAAHDFSRVHAVYQQT